MIGWPKVISVKEVHELTSKDTLLVYEPSGVAHAGIAKVFHQGHGTGNLVVELLGGVKLELPPATQVLVVN